MVAGLGMRQSLGWHILRAVIRAGIHGEIKMSVFAETEIKMQPRRLSEHRCRQNHEQHRCFSQKDHYFTKH